MCHWLIIVHRFQVCKSVYLIVCLPLKGLSPSVTTHLTPFTICWSPNPFPLATTIPLSVSMGFCSFAFFVHLWFSVVCPTYDRDHVICWCFLSRSIYCHKWQHSVFSYGWVVFRCIHVAQSSSSHLSKGTSWGYFHVLAPWTMLACELVSENFIIFSTLL